MSSVQTVGSQASQFPSEQWVSKWVEVINANDDISRLGKFFTANVYFRFGDDKSYILNVYRGRVQDVILDPIWDKAWDFGIAASTDTWKNSIERIPRPFYQDIFGMMWNHGMTIEGNKVQAMQNIRVLKLILAAMKEV